MDLTTDQRPATKARTTGRLALLFTLLLIAIAACGTKPRPNGARGTQRRACG